MRNFDATKYGKPSDYELNDEELEKVVGGDAKNSAKGSAKDTTEPPREAISLNFTKIMFD
jgi:hypothetical protein